MAAGDDSIKSNECSEFYEAINKTHKVTGDTNAVPISDLDLEADGTSEIDAFDI